MARVAIAAMAEYVVKRMFVADKIDGGGIECSLYRRIAQRQVCWNWLGCKTEYEMLELTVDNSDV